MAAFFKKPLRPRRVNSIKNGPYQEKKQTHHPSQSLLLSTDIDSNLNYLKAIFQDCSDVIFREFLLAQNEQIKLALIYTDGLTDKTQISEQIMRALTLEIPMVVHGEEITRANALHFIKMKGLCINQVRESQKIEEIVSAILSGETVLLVDGHSTALINDIRSWEMRAIEDSKTETVVRGPRESFVETLRTNTSMLRRKIKNPNLKIEMTKLGEVSKTDIAVAYIKGIVNQDLVTEVKSRLEKIKIDGILDSGYLEELIKDNAYSPFSTISHTDRPDRVAANLLEGRVAILVDGTPVVLTMPYIFLETIQTPEDYYEQSFFTSVIRILRIGSLIASLTLPSLYIAIISFHHEMLPTPLLLSMAAQREAVPFPVFVEAFLMEIAFEIIREAGIRLPRPVGQAVSIVAALIIGEAAVQAGLVAAATVIVVSLTAMASFTIYYSGSITIRLLRFPLMILAASLGLFGLISGITIFVVHMAGLRSFGVPYLAPVGPIITGDLKDSVVRVPWWAMNKRPYLMGQNNPQREASRLKPQPSRPKK
ncbi:spore germination protein KA [Desulfohalotomaculum tongense]|uniref:spore germination protein n=1 Tax=Desulforadius tongensis TaxID=1216062 RepID=UPI001956991B|nr:spore germination protein [Desulforadius tongensis]MBM7856123.1 spore germination protein KA [Desulforadius tongensis]